jgi:hypothetical protein
VTRTTTSTEYNDVATYPNTATGAAAQLLADFQDQLVFPAAGEDPALPVVPFSQYVRIEAQDMNADAETWYHLNEMGPWMWQDLRALASEATESEGSTLNIRFTVFDAVRTLATNGALTWPLVSQTGLGTFLLAPSNDILTTVTAADTIDTSTADDRTTVIKTDDYTGVAFPAIATKAYTYDGELLGVRDAADGTNTLYAVRTTLADAGGDDSGLVTALFGYEVPSGTSVEAAGNPTVIVSFADNLIPQTFANLAAPDRTADQLFAVDMNVDPSLPQYADVTGRMAFTLVSGADEEVEQPLMFGGFLLSANRTMDQLACLAEGTLIRLADGRDVPVQDLKTGDLVLNRMGAPVPVKGLYAGTYTPSPLANDGDATPVRVPAHFFGPSLPSQDLYMSANHAILTHGPDLALGTDACVYVPASAFAFPQARPDKALRYFQVHTADCLGVLANGIPVSNWTDHDDHSSMALIA